MDVDTAKEWSMHARASLQWQETAAKDPRQNAQSGKGRLLTLPLTLNLTLTLTLTLSLIPKPSPDPNPSQASATPRTAYATPTTLTGRRPRCNLAYYHPSLPMTPPDHPSEHSVPFPPRHSP